MSDIGGESQTVEKSSTLLGADHFSGVYASIGERQIAKELLQIGTKGYPVYINFIAKTQTTVSLTYTNTAGTEIKISRYDAVQKKVITELYTNGSVITVDAGATLKFINWGASLSDQSPHFTTTGQFQAAGYINGFILGVKDHRLSVMREDQPVVASGLFLNNTGLEAFQQLAYSAQHTDRSKGQYEITSYSFHNTFKGCTGLQSVSLKSDFYGSTDISRCFQSMFQGCSSLKTATVPVAVYGRKWSSFYGRYTTDSQSFVPAYNCKQMFAGCTDLQYIKCLSNRPSDLKAYCYDHMFESCQHLSGINLSDFLSLNTLAEYACNYMFQGCSSLHSVNGNLPAKSLQQGCYHAMFLGCTSLTKAPNMLATTLAENCCSMMYYGCRLLNEVPPLLAQRLQKECYASMFRGCSNLDHLTVRFSSWDQQLQSTTLWLDQVAQVGLLKCPQNLPDTPRDGSHIPVRWNAATTEYFRITSTQKASVTLNIIGSPNISKLKYRQSTQSEWKLYSRQSKPFNLKKFQFVEFYNQDSTLSLNQNDYVNFKISGNIQLTGNFNSLINFSKSCSDYCFYKLFADCRAIYQTLDLPMKAVAPYCYAYMFQNCTNIRLLGNLSATVMQDSCYQGMFSGCIRLENAPELPAQKLASYCYSYMFQNCPIKQAPSLRAANLTNGCYMGMFKNTKLTSPALIPEELQLQSSCFQSMYQDCKQLSSCPQLLITNLKPRCYAYMFAGCTRLTEGPKLPSTQLISQCYYGMFQGCSQLKSVSVDFLQWNSAQNCTTDWLTGVATEGVFYCPQQFQQPGTRGGSTVPVKWVLSNQSKYLVIQSQYRAQVHLQITGSPHVSDLQYCIIKNSQGGQPQWKSFPLNSRVSVRNSGFSTYQLGKNESRVKIFIRNNSTQLSLDKNNYVTIVVDSGFVYGKLQGLLNQSTNCPAFSFYRLFYQSNPSVGSTGGIHLSDRSLQLNAVTVGQSSYQSMFQGQTQSMDLRGMILFATDLSSAPRCYKAMFKNCSRLSIGPGVLAETTGESCFQQMFSGCTGLQMVRGLQIQTAAKACCKNMYLNCTGIEDDIYLGHLWPEALNQQSYYGMFQGCTNLEIAPEIDATDLSQGKQACMYMFKDCTRLKKAPQLKAASLAQDCYKGMFEGCTSLKQAMQQLPATTLSQGCYQQVFKGCTSLAKSPVLPAKTAVTGCYVQMFYGCSALTQLYAYVQQLDPSYSNNWMCDVYYKGTAYCSDQLDLTTRDATHVPPPPWNAQQEYLQFKAYSTVSTVKLTIFAGSPTVDGIEYKYTSSDPQAEPTTWESYTIDQTITLQPNDYVEFRNTNNTLNRFNLQQGPSVQDIAKFVMTGKILASGDLQSMLNFQQNCNRDGCFAQLFSGCACMQNYSLKLNAKTLTPYCYYELFAGCTSLGGFLKIPSTTLAEGCYMAMFQGCRFQMTPELPATQLAKNCYTGMFAGNDQLWIYTKEFPAQTVLAEGCFQQMFASCKKLPQPIALPFQTLPARCYSGMFSGCTSLKIPVGYTLPARDLTHGEEYYQMFQYCTAITNGPKIAAVTYTANSCKEMFDGCSSMNSLWIKIKSWF